MGSANHPPQFLDRAALKSIRAAYNEIYDVIQGQDVFKPVVADDEELKLEILRRLLVLVSDGTPPRDFKAKVLRSLPFR